MPPCYRGGLVVTPCATIPERISSAIMKLSRWSRELARSVLWIRTSRNGDLCNVAHNVPGPKYACIQKLQNTRKLQKLKYAIHTKYKIHIYSFSCVFRVFTFVSKMSNMFWHVWSILDNKFIF